MKQLNGMSVILTEACNLSCSYCYEKRKTPEVMTEDTAIKAVDFLVANRQEGSRPSIMWFGGEPLLNFDVLRHAVAYTRVKLPTCDQLVITNGTILTDDIFVFFEDRPWLRLQLSWDGMPMYQDAERGLSAVFEENLLRWKTLKNHIDVHVQITPKMVPGLAENLRYIHDHIPNAKIVLRPIGEVDGWDENTLRTFFDQLKIAMWELHDTIDKVANCANDFHSEGVCGAGKNFGSIAPNGDIYACHRFYFGTNRDFKVGTLDGGFIASAKAEILEEYNRDNIIGCTGCPAYERCDRCIACNFSETGDVLLPKVSSCEASTALYFAVVNYMSEFRPWLLREPPFKAGMYPIVKSVKSTVGILNHEVFPRLAAFEEEIMRLKYQLEVQAKKHAFDINQIRKGGKQ